MINVKGKENPKCEIENKFYYFQMKACCNLCALHIKVKLQRVIVQDY